MSEFILVVSILFVVGMISKLADSTLGLGYGTLLAPALLILEYPVQEVVPAVLLSEFLSAGLTAIGHRATGNISGDPHSRDFKVSSLLAILGFIGALAGVFIAISISMLFITVYVSLTVIITGVLVIRGFAWRFTWKKMTAFGILASINKSVSGGGYGSIVAGGQIISGRESTKAVGTTAVAEAAVTGFSWLFYSLLDRTTVTWDMILGQQYDIIFSRLINLEIPLIIGAVLSAPLAVYLVKRVEPRKLTPYVGGAAVVLGILTLLKTLFGITIMVLAVLIVFIAFVVVIVLTEYNNRRKGEVAEVEALEDQETDV